MSLPEVNITDSSVGREGGRVWGVSVSVCVCGIAQYGENREDVSGVCVCYYKNLKHQKNKNR